MTMTNHAGPDQAGMTSGQRKQETFPILTILYKNYYKHNIPCITVL